ncbi:MAG: hypothetical protein AMXMBFR4_06180 [Candidatus Hydrogenedentota bacterium]
MRVSVSSGLFIAAFLACEFLAALTHTNYGISLWYAPAGLAMAVLLFGGLGYALPYYFAKVAAASIVLPFPPGHGTAHVLVLALVPVLTYTMAAFAIRNWLHVNTLLERNRDLVRFLSVVPISTTLASFGFVGVMWLEDLLPAGEVVRAAADFWIGDVVGILSLTPFLLSFGFPWCARKVRFLIEPSRLFTEAPGLIRAKKRQLVETLAWSVALGGALWIAFGGPRGGELQILYPCYLPLIWAGIQRGVPGASTTILAITAACALWGKSVDLAPAPGIQLFLIATSLTGLFLGSAASERARAIADLREIHQIYRQAISAADAVPYVRDFVRNRYSYMGEGIKRLTGYAAGELEPQMWAKLCNKAEVLGEGAGMELQEAIRRARSGEFKVWRSNSLFTRKDGQKRWIADAAVQVFDESGKLLRALGMLQDITEIKKAEEALRRSRDILYSLLENVPAAVAMLDRNLRYTVVSHRYIEDFRLEKDIVGKHIEEVFPEVRGDTGFHARVERCLKGAIESGDETRFVRKDGSEHWLRWEVRPWYDLDGEIGGLIILSEVITERIRAERALRASEAYTRLIVDTALDAVITMDAAGRITSWNRQAERVFGWKRDEVTGRSVAETIVPHHMRDMFEKARQHYLATGEAPIIGRLVDFHGLRRNGEIFPAELSVTPIHAPDGAVSFSGFIRDITERKRAEDAQKRSRSVLYSFVEHTPAAVAMLDRELRYLAVSKRWLTDYRLQNEDIIGRHHYDVFPEIRRMPHWLAIHQRCLAGAVCRSDEDRFVRQDGQEDWIRWEVRPWTDERGEIGGIIMFTEVVTERIKAQKALKQSEERLDLALKGADLGLWDWNIQTGEVIFDERWAGMLGYAVNELEPHLDTWKKLVHPDDYDRVSRVFKAHLNGEIPFYETEHRLRAKSGEWKWILDRGRVVEWDGHGKPVRATGTHLDITERKKAEEERQQLEAQMLHAQKLESLGVLAGGIAHDFNNLLVGVLGNADLALLESSPASAIRENLEAIVTSAQRAADLCKQMLAYSGRGRFVVLPVQLNELVQEMAHLLSVSVSKRVSIQYNLADHLPLVEADPTQVRQVIMNLITNASEAIGDNVGTIRISTGVMECDREHLRDICIQDDLEPGSYVMLEIQDSGCGMDTETQKRIFDPFFTTKFTGRGLGMAAVLGIVRGHKGGIQLRSEPGLGTTFRVLFPAHDVADIPGYRPTVDGDLLEASGLVLVVDDEEPVRAIARALLERAGFTVLSAPDGHEALDIFRQRHREIEFVLLDVTMPTLGGREVLHEMRKIQSDVRIILSSGFDEKDALTQVSAERITAYIQKPYRSQEFYAAIRAALDTSTQRS